MTQRIPRRRSCIFYSKKICAEIENSYKNPSRSTLQSRQSQIERSSTPLPSLEATALKRPITPLGYRKGKNPKPFKRSKSAPSIERSQIPKTRNKKTNKKVKNERNIMDRLKVTKSLLKSLRNPKFKVKKMKDGFSFEYAYVQYLNRQFEKRVKRRKFKKIQKLDHFLPCIVEESSDHEISQIMDQQSPTKKKRKKTQSNSVFSTHGVFSQIFPTNEKAEKEKFLRGDVENPNFTYLNNNSSFRTLKTWSQPCIKYVKEAIRILHKAKDYQGGIDKYLKNSLGEKLSSEDSLNYFTYYLNTMGLASKCRIRLSLAAATATSVHNTDLILRLPIEYHALQIQGIANHEIGTHMLRRMNDRKQVWYKKRKKYNLNGFLKTEEGLACLNTHVGSKYKLLARAALHYYAACRAATMSFRELFDDLATFISDPNRRWAECLRIKRGIQDQSLPGCFSKDQIYLAGAIEILRRKEEIDWKLLYSGKIILDDMDNVKDIVNLDCVRLPLFLQDVDLYMKELQEIQDVNEI